MDLQILSRQNPWWVDSAHIRDDPTLAILSSQTVKWSPRLLHRFRLDRDRVYTLRGPRQVGKTTMVKALVRRLLEETRVDGRAILYFSCDLLRGPADLVDAIETYLEWQAPFRLPRRYLFLDEVSSVADWSLAVRALANRGRTRKCTLVLTGSHALDVSRQVERLPGRRGEALAPDEEDPLDKVLLPMKFAEYAETLSARVRGVLEQTGLLSRRIRWDTLEALYGGSPSGTWSALQLLRGETDRFLKDYLLTGGFPRPLNEFRGRGRIPTEVYDLHIRVLTGDLARWGSDERTARELLAAIVDKMGTPVSWRTLASEADLGSHNTAAKYVESLEKTFTLQTVYQYDPRRRRKAPKKDRKIYVADPFMFHAIRGWALGLAHPYDSSVEYVSNPRTRGLLLEAVAGDHLARVAFASGPASVFDAYEHVMFWRARKGWEVDFVLRAGPKPMAFQITATRPDSDTYRSLRTFGGGIVLTETGEKASVPLSAFLLLA